MIPIEAVASKVSKWLVVCLLCATLGAQWDLLQSVAWVGMIVNYSRHGSLTEAVTKTFDGHHPCPLCKLVHAGQSQEKKPESQQSVNKIDLFAEAGPVFHFPTLAVSDFPSPPFKSSRSNPPLLPPPRPLFG